MAMLTRGNTKLGDDIWGFTIPARITCPGKTAPCEAVCYADGFLFRRHLNRNAANWQRTRQPGFIADIRSEIRTFGVRVLRIHIGGDFDSAAYVHKWTSIAKPAKRTTFFFYTRSWRIPTMRTALLELASLPNVFAHWSEDRETGPTTMPAGVGRRAFMCATRADETLVPKGVLVFRNQKRGQPRKWINHSWVCPPEQGTSGKAHVTCTRCRRCFTPGPFPTGPE